MEKRKLNLVKTVVGFDDAIEDKSHRYDCYINTHNRYWNGWANPYFEQKEWDKFINCLLYTSPSPRDLSTSRMPSSA